VLVLVLALSVGALAFQNEPEGFRGLLWGDPPAEDMEFLSKLGNSDVYRCVDEKMALGSAQFYLIAYLFWQERFEAVALYFRGEKNHDLLGKICKQRYGEDELQRGFYEIKWEGSKAFVMLTYDSIEEEGFLSLASTGLTLVKQKAEELVVN